jgi:hypothetical protein
MSTPPTPEQHEREAALAERHPAGTPAPDGRDLGGAAWASLRFDAVLAPGRT